MKFIARGMETTVFITGAVAVTFRGSVKALEDLQKLKKDDYYITIEKVSRKRSLNQNAMLWKMVGEIDKTINGRRTEEDDMEIYCQILEMASVKSYLIQCAETSQDFVRKQFRASRVLGRDEDRVLMEVYPGTSDMNSAEMKEVIEQALRYAEEVGLNTDIYREELNE